MINLFTTRLGTALVALAWVMSWGLLFIHIGFILMEIPAIYILLVLILQDPRDRSKYFLLPVIRYEFNHNQRAKILRQIERLELKECECSSLIEEIDAAGEWLSDTQIPVLIAERNDAGRRQDQLREDVRALEEAWVLEDRERRYKQIVGH